MPKEPSGLQSWDMDKGRHQAASPRNVHDKDQTEVVKEKLIKPKNIESSPNKQLEICYREPRAVRDGSVSPRRVHKNTKGTVGEFSVSPRKRNEKKNSKMERSVSPGRNVTKDPPETNHDLVSTRNSDVKNPPTRGRGRSNSPRKGRRKDMYIDVEIKSTEIGDKISSTTMIDKTGYSERPRERSVSPRKGGLKHQYSSRQPPERERTTEGRELASKISTDAGGKTDDRGKTSQSSGSQLEPDKLTLSNDNAEHAAKEKLRCSAPTTGECTVIAKNKGPEKKVDAMKTEREKERIFDGIHSDIGAGVRKIPITPGVWRKPEANN